MTRLLVSVIVVSMVKKAYLDKDFGKELVERLFTQEYCLAILIDVISGLNPSGDTKQLKDIKLDLVALKKFMGLTGNNATSKLKASVRKIRDTSVEFDDGRIWEPVSFFNRAYIDNETSTVHIDINARFLPYLTNLKKFLVISRSAIKANLRSQRLYAYLRGIHRDTPKRVKPEDIQNHLGVNYPTYGTFKQQFLKPIQEDLKQAGIDIAFTENKGVRNKVESLDFFLNEPQEKVDKVITEAKAKEIKSRLPSTHWQVNQQYSAKQYADLQKTKDLLEESSLKMTPEEIEEAAIAREAVKKSLSKLKIQGDED